MRFLDLTSLRQNNGTWELSFAKSAPTHPVHSVLLQVEIVKLLGMDNEVMLVTDGTGKAKVTKGSNVPGEFSWLKHGSKCSIMGTVSDNGKIPHVQATKIARVASQVQIEMWPLEVKELRNYFSNLVIPNVT